MTRRLSRALSLVIVAGSSLKVVSHAFLFVNGSGKHTVANDLEA